MLNNADTSFLLWITCQIAVRIAPWTEDKLVISLRGVMYIFKLSSIMGSFIWIIFKEFKRGNRVSSMEVSCCTFGFGAIIRRDLCTLSLPRDSPCDNQYACAIWVHAGKATHAQRNNLAGLVTKKSGGTITRLHTCHQNGRHNRFPL